MAALHVQSASGLFGGSGTTAAATSPGNVTAGNLLGVYVGFSNDTATVTSLTDTLGNTYPAMTGQAGGNSKGWYSSVVSAFSGANTVTVVMSAAGGGAIAVHEASGIQATTPLDKVAFVPQVGTGTGTNGVTTGNVTPTTDGQYLFAAAHDDSFSGVAFTPGTSVAYVGRESANDAGFHVRTESFVQTTAAAVAGTFTASVNGDTVNILLTFKAATAASNPFVTQIGAQLIPRGKPNYAATLCSFVLGTALTLTNAGIQPFSQTAWPLPVRAVSAPMAALTHTQARPQFYQDIKPFAQNAWPLPQVPPLLLSVTIGTRPPLDSVAAVTLPSSQTDWPLPQAKPWPIALRTWTQERKPYYTDIQPFRQTNWPPGRAMPPAPGLTSITQSPEQGVLSLPVGGIPDGRSWLPLPPARPPLPMALLQWVLSHQQFELPLSAGTPLTQADWPLPPQPKPEPITKRTHLSFYVVDTTDPIRGATSLLPLGKPWPMTLRTWTQAKPTALVSATLPTGRQQDWPVPVRPQPEVRTWTQSLITSTLSLPIGTPGVPQDWPLPLRSGQIGTLRTWTQNLIASTLAPAGWGRLLGGERNHLVREIT